MRCRSLSYLTVWCCLAAASCDENSDSAEEDDQGDEHGHSDHDHDHSDSGTDNGATCPEDGRPTYDEDIAPFIESYCLGCHSSELSGADREGATVGVDFDSEQAVRDEASHIDAVAGAGPDAVNTFMPPSSAQAQPSTEERELFSTWVACLDE